MTTLPALRLTRALRNAVLFTDPGDYIPSLNAVRLQMTDDRLVLDATDRYKLLRQELDLPEPAPAGPVVVSRSALLALVKSVEAAVREGWVKRDRNTIQAQVRLVEGLQVQLPTVTEFSAPALDLADSAYPAVERLLTMPHRPTDHPVGLNGEHLRAFADVRVEAGRAPWWRMTVHGRAGRPVMTHWTVESDLERHSCVALLMPVLFEGDA